MPIFNLDHILSYYKTQYNIRSVLIENSKIIVQVDNVKDMNCVTHNWKILIQEFALSLTKIL